MRRLLRWSEVPLLTLLLGTLVLALHAAPVLTSVAVAAAVAVALGRARWSSRARQLMAVACVLAIAGCTASTAKRAIVSAADAQVVLANAYLDALAQEQAAIGSCKRAAEKATLTLPSAAADPEGTRRACATLGYPIPYDLEALEKWGRSVNASKSAVEAANTIRKGVDQGVKTRADLDAALARLRELVLQVYDAAVALGVSPPAEAQAFAGGAR